MVFTFKIGKLTSIDFTSLDDIKEAFGINARVLSMELEVPTNLDEGIHLTMVVENADLAKIAESGNLFIEQFKAKGLY
jgi:hypothetical protein